MRRLIIACATLVFTLGGPAVADERRHYKPHHDDGPRYERFERRDEHRYRDRYDERRHNHHAPGYDARYRWYDGRAGYAPPRYHRPPVQVWRPYRPGYPHFNHPHNQRIQPVPRRY